MNIKEVKQEGKSIKVIDDNNNELASLSDVNGKVEGHGVDFFVLSSDETISTYTAQGKKIAEVAANNKKVLTVAGSTFNIEEGNWLRVYDKDFTKVSEKSEWLRNI